jgi:hypothetical protein
MADGLVRIAANSVEMFASHSVHNITAGWWRSDVYLIETWHSGRQTERLM